MERDLNRLFKDFIEQADSMNARIERDINLYRKGDATITVMKNGQPVEANIVAEQKTHDFKFGANCFMLDELETEEKNKTYKELFKNVFNLATVPFYWDALEPEQGKPRFDKDSPKIYRRPAPDLCLEFCRENGIEPKLHCLNYDHFIPEWYKNKDLETQKQLLTKHFQDIADRYKDSIPDMEVTNEHSCWPREGSSPMYLSPEYVDFSYALADKLFPDNNLIINDDAFVMRDSYTVTERSAYYLLIEKMLKDGLRVDKIGFQAHIWTWYEDMYKNTEHFFNPQNLFHVLDVYAKLVPCLQITEITLPCKGDAPEDEEYQAQVLEYLYRIWFSHPAMDAIIYWNLVDGYAYGAEQGDMTAGENQLYGGLLNFDLSPKKAFLKLQDLIHKEWHTHAQLQNGESFRGFYGKYNVTVVADGKTVTKEVHLAKNQDNNFVIEL